MVARTPCMHPADHFNLDDSVLSQDSSLEEAIDEEQGCKYPLCHLCLSHSLKLDILLLGVAVRDQRSLRF